MISATALFLPEEPCDLIWSCEFLEHVEERFVGNILRTFSFARKAILVTHAFPGQHRGHHHVNLRPSSYWIRLIEALGFQCDGERSRQARTLTLQDYPGVNHFARSGLVFVRDPGTEQYIGKTPPSAKAGTFTGIGKLIQTECKAFTIHQGFRWSTPFRTHLKKRRAAKRAARRFQR